jgi:hypothetical protein
VISPARLSASLLVLLLACEVRAGESPYRYQELSFEIPEPFKDRRTGPPSMYRSNIPDVAFRATDRQDPPYDVMQFRAGVIPGFSPGRDQEEDLYFVAQFLDKMMDDMKVVRVAFGRTEAKRVKLGSHLALRASWVGMKEGHQMNGVMFCMLVGAKAFHLSVMGPGGKPDDTLKLGIRAIERLAFAAPN